MKPLMPTIPHMIIMLGIPGAGKTHFAENFAKMFGAPFLNQQALQTITGSTDAQATELSSKLLDELLKTQRTIIFEGPTYSMALRQALTRKAHKAGYETLLVWVQTETGEAKSRIKKNGKREIHDNYDLHLNQFIPPNAREKSVVISGRHTFASQVKVVLKHLAGKRPVVETKLSPRPTPSGQRIKIG